MQELQQMLPFPECIGWDAGSRIHSAGLAVCYVHSVAGGRIMLKVLIRKSLHGLPAELRPLKTRSKLDAGTLIMPYNGRTASDLLGINLMITGD